MHKDYIGSTPTMVLLLLVIISLISFTGWHVYESNKKVNQSLDNSLKTSEGSSSSLQNNADIKKIVAVGDIVCDPNETNSSGSNLSSCQSNATFTIVKSINPDAILTLGDLQYSNGSLDRFQTAYEKSWGQVKGITYPSPGNHEYETADAKGYFSYFGERAGELTKGYYSFNIGSWHLVALNSNCKAAGGCNEGSPQLKWLIQDLRSNKYVCTAAFWHHPHFTSGRYANDVSSKSLSDDFWSELSKYKADVVLNGHDHLYERFAPQESSGESNESGIRQFTVGTGGKSHYKKTTSAANSEIIIDDRYGVLLMELGSKNYKWQFISTDGEVLDTGTKKCT